jgi:hypothetical protein
MRRCRAPLQRSDRALRLAVGTIRVVEDEEAHRGRGDSSISSAGFGTAETLGLPQLAP